MIKVAFTKTTGEEISEQIVIPTIFPDGTSQVWGLNLPNILNNVEILWYFENEAECMHIIQLAHLLKSRPMRGFATLNIPTMPYARQDKSISNETTFALLPFINLLDTLPVDIIKTFDVHNSLILTNGLKNVKFYNEQPYRMVQIAENRKPDAIFFPDKGAKARYGNLFRHLKNFHFNMVPHICGEKVRDPLSGNITGYSVGDIGVATSVLVCDDLVDAGGTFVLAAEELIKSGVKRLDLYASHLIQRKAIDRLIDAGYSTIYTKDTEYFQLGAK